MVDGFSSIVLILIQPSLWWLWETVILVSWGMAHLFRPWGKIKGIRMRKIGEKWFAAKPVWIPLRARKFGVGKSESHTVETEFSPYTELQSLGVTTPVLFYNIKKTRPMIVETSEIDHEEKANKGKRSLNPDSEEFNIFSRKEAFKQLLKANAIGHPDLVIFLILIGLGIGIGWILNGMLNPPHNVYIPIRENTTNVQTRILKP